jgi:hypothetical protein
MAGCQTDAIDRAPRGREPSVREGLTRIIVDWSGSWQIALQRDSSLLPPTPLLTEFQPFYDFAIAVRMKSPMLMYAFLGVQQDGLRRSQTQDRQGAASLPIYGGLDHAVPYCCVCGCGRASRTVRGQTMRVKMVGAALALLVTSGGAIAGEQSTASVHAALELGSVLGSETACSLTYDQNAIQNYIVKHVDADDMMFATSLNGETEYAKNSTKEMSASSLTAHCTQIRRVAKQYGFARE